MQHVFAALTNQPWLITAESLQTLIDVAVRYQSDRSLAEQLRAARDARPSAVALREGRPLAGAVNATVRDGVAIVPITGPIVRYADFFTQVSGLASVEAVAADLGAALAAPEVRSIVLSIDSPGGQVTGIAALAEQINAARAQKPIRAYVEMAASAGYWLASAASHIVADHAALLGSIGAVLAVRDPSKQPSRDVEFVSSQSPHKRASPTSAAGQAEYQRVVDQTAEAFIEAVARYRGISAAAVQQRYGQGGMLVGRHAVAAGLADELGTLEGALFSAAPGRPVAGPEQPGRRSAAELEQADLSALYDQTTAWAARRGGHPAPEAPAHPAPPTAPTEEQQAAASARAWAERKNRRDRRP